MGAITKTTCHPLYFLDLDVYSLAKSVGDSMPCVGNNIIYVGLDHLSHLLHRLKPTMSHPEIRHSGGKGIRSPIADKLARDLVGVCPAVACPGKFDAALINPASRQIRTDTLS